MTQYAVTVEHIAKEYLLGLRAQSNQTFRELISGLATAPLRRLRHLSGIAEDAGGRFWALDDVSFNVADGGVLGIIGHNGAGKSTLLKILSRITEPTRGRATVQGRVASLLEVGTGFHSELSGRENIFLNGAVLGMTRVEIARKFDEIVAFSGVEKFLDTPIKRYSSGMKVRLAFAVAAHLEPEVLIVDEVLAVGDAEFRRKCLGKMNDVASGGRTVLFVSHNMAAVENLCDRAIVLDAGKVIFDGDSSNAVSLYHKQHSELVTDDLRHAPRNSGHRPIIHKVEIRERGEEVPTLSVPSGAAITIDITYDSPEPLVDAGFGLTFETFSGSNLFCLHTRQQTATIELLPQEGTLRCHIERLPLLPGTYFISPYCGIRKRVADRIERGLRLDVVERDIFGTGFIPTVKNGPVFQDALWTSVTHDSVLQAVGSVAADG